MSRIEVVIRQFVSENLLFGREELKLSDEASFLELGIIDSTGVLELVTFLEETYQIKIEDEELIPSNLDSIKSICEFINVKRRSTIVVNS